MVWCLEVFILIIQEHTMSVPHSTGIPNHWPHISSLQPHGDHMVRNQENDANRVLNMQHLQEGHDIKVTQWVFSRWLAMMGTKTRLNEDASKEKDGAQEPHSHRHRIYQAWLSPEPSAFPHIHHSKKHLHSCQWSLWDMHLGDWSTKRQCR
jgi:hypothetical protein